MSDGVRLDIGEDLVQAFLRLARGDFSVRLERNFRRDTADTLAYFINLMAEELERLLSERDRDHRALEAAIDELTEHFLSFAEGDFSVRAHRTYSSDPVDVLAYLFNNSVSEVGDAFAELRRQREVVEGILTSMIDGVFLLDDTAAIVRTNRAMERILGYEQGALEQASLSSILADRDQEFASKILSQVAIEPLRDRQTLFWSHAGTPIALTVNASAQHDNAGNVIGAVFVVRDDRDLHRAQARLQMMDRLATMGTIAAGVAHEVNNPLSFVLGNLEFVEEELDAAGVELAGERLEEVRAAVADVRSGAERVSEIVRELKAYARSDAASITSIDPARLVDASLRMIRNEVRHRARLMTEHRGAPMVTANEGRLVQVVINLVQNAAHAIAPGAVQDNQIVVTTGTTRDGEAFIEVRDTGCGISAENLARIFDAFFTTKTGVGTGLGLSICQQIVTAANGRLEVDSAPGQGSTFRVVLPAAACNEASEPTEASQPQAGGARRRVLVVDDERAIGDFVRRLLREHEVDIATSGLQALTMLEGRHFHLVLCDVHMPEMTGPQLFERVIAVRPDLESRFVFMTGGEIGFGGRKEIARTRRPLVDKPFDGPTLRRLLEAD